MDNNTPPAMTNTTSLYNAAVFYVQEWSVPVLPLKPTGKEPLGECVPHGFKDATCDRTHIEAWWREHPDANIGMPTGSVSGRFVVDIDMDADAGKDGMATWAQLVATHGDVDVPMVLTPRGGHHLYFRHVEGLGSRKLGRDIDTRGEGGYVLLPPSIVHGKPYTEDVGASFDESPLREPPAWLVEKLLTAPPVADSAPVPSSGKSLVLADLEVSDRIKYLILHGDSLQRYPSRSEALAAGELALITAGYGDDDIITVLSDPVHALAAKVLEKGVKWLRADIARARARRAPTTPRAPIPRMWHPIGGGREAVVPPRQPRRVITAAEMPSRRMITRIINSGQEG